MDDPGFLLWREDEDGQHHLNIPRFEFAPLNDEKKEQRFIILQPSAKNLNEPENYVRCELKTIPLDDAPPFIAIKNARGYRLLTQVIEVNGKAHIISAALEAFLRHFRAMSNEPIRLWTRYLCVNEFSEEQPKYWTRDWCDMMYAKATDVVDMHEFNATHIENGAMRTVVEPEHRNWRKDWMAQDQRAVNPKVFPFRLGLMPKSDIPTHDYQYVPLDPVADEIRVIILHPAQDESAPLVVHLGHCPIRCEVRFAALSYRWGLSEETTTITAMGMKMQIRKGLAEALRSMRRKEHELPIWVDAISINQEDVMERGRQVARMGEIFDHASAIWSYTGPKTDDSDEAIFFIKELKKHPMMRVNDSGEWHFGQWDMKGEGQGVSYDENPIGPERLPALCAALYKFLNRSYFRRAWVLQELAFASSAAVGVGQIWGLAYDDLDKATQNFMTMLRDDIVLRGQIAEQDASFGDVGSWQLAFVRKLFYFRHLISSGQWRAIPLGIPIAEQSPGYLETLILARDFECTDPHDKIFALWNLARDKDGLEFESDYTKSIPDTYRDFAKAWIVQHQKLDIIGAVESCAASADFYQKAPSWVPNWSTSATASCLVREEHIPDRPMMSIGALDGAFYSADGDMSSTDTESPLFHLEGDVLCCTGIILDTIETVLEAPTDIPSGTLSQSGDPETAYKFACWVAQVERHYTKHPEPCPYSDPLQAVWAMLHGDVVSSWPLREQNPDNADYDYDEKYVAIARDPYRPQPCVTPSRRILGYAGGYERRQARDVVKQVLRGRRPFVTENGYMGLAPAYIEQGAKPWLLAIIATCSVPLLLRERDDGSYQICGTCFVQGWMEGEVFSEMMGADNPQEFWSSVGDGATLRIA